MRLDLFLKASRLCAGRSVAQRLCDAGLVSLNNQPAKSAHAVKAGDRISIKTKTRLLIVAIETVPTNRNTPRKEAAMHYRVIEDERFLDEADSGI
jgi:ribosomal 50S subunit-recycling heat shock protein